MTDLLFDLKKLLTMLVLPPASLLLLAVVGLVLVQRRPRLALGLVWSSVIALIVCALPGFTLILAGLVRTPSELAGEAASRAQAVVVLAGGRRSAAEYGGETIAPFTLERLRYGAKLAKERGLPLLLTGGVVHHGTPESELMARALEESFGMRARWIERRSRDTHQNAVYSAAILKDASIRTVLLVTHDFHQRRSIAEFEAAGIEAVCAPVTMVSGARASPVLYEQLPGAQALWFNMLILRELLANVVIWARGA